VEHLRAVSPQHRKEALSHQLSAVSKE